MRKHRAGINCRSISGDEREFGDTVFVCSAPKYADKHLMICLIALHNWYVWPLGNDRFWNDLFFDSGNPTRNIPVLIHFLVQSTFRDDGHQIPHNGVDIGSIFGILPPVHDDIMWDISKSSLPDVADEDLPFQ